LRTLNSSLNPPSTPADQQKRTLARRANALRLYQDYVAQQLSMGMPPKGLEQAFAASLQISPSLWSQIKSSRPIGDKLARQMEAHAGKSVGWLDQSNSEERAPDAAEERFVEMAREAWRQSNAKGKRALAQAIKAGMRAAE
jgi:hypothetical protein